MVTNITPQAVCLACSKPLTPNGTYCPFCGTRVAASPVAAEIEAQVQKHVDLELSDRLKDQNAMVRELADKVEDVIWKRFGRYTILLGLLISVIIGAFTFYGITTFSGASEKIEPVIQAAVAKTKTAKQNVERLDARVESVRHGIDNLSILLNKQTQRVTEKTSEISLKLAAFDASQKRMTDYLNRADAMYRQLDAVQKSLQTRVQQVSNQADDILVKRVYPNLGRAIFVTLNGQPWRDKSEKSSKETWVNINVAPAATGNYSTLTIEKLMIEMKRQNYIPILGMFGVGGPYEQGFGALDLGPGTHVVYFRKDEEPKAVAFAVMASKALSRVIKAKFFDPSSIQKNDMRAFIINQSGLDLQLCLGSQ